MKKAAKKKSKAVRRTSSKPNPKTARRSTRAAGSKNESRQSAEESRDFPDAIYLDR